MTAVQTGPTNITVSWSSSSDATGYRIDYNSIGGNSGSVTISGGSIDMETLTGLQNGDTYTISIVATSEHFYSNAVEVSNILLYTGIPGYSVYVHLICYMFSVPDPPVISMDPPTTATSISLSWTSAGSVVDSYEVMWSSTQCPGDTDKGNTTISDTSYTIDDLRGGTAYTITVTATNVAGTSSPSDEVMVETLDNGK